MIAGNSVDGWNRYQLFIIQMTRSADRISLLETFVRIAERGSVTAAAREEGATAARAEREKRTKYSKAELGVNEFVPLSHETYGRVAPATFAFLHRIAEQAASAGAVDKRTFLENAMRELSTTMCRALARQVRACGPMRARIEGKLVLAGKSKPTDELEAIVINSRPA